MISRPNVAPITPDPCLRPECRCNARRHGRRRLPTSDPRLFHANPLTDRKWRRHRRWPREWRGRCSRPSLRRKTTQHWEECCRRRECADRSRMSKVTTLRSRDIHTGSTDAKRDRTLFSVGGLERNIKSETSFRLYSIRLTTKFHLDVNRNHTPPTTISGIPKLENDASG